jgi:hypothetical protein
MAGGSAVGAQAVIFYLHDHSFIRWSGKTGALFTVRTMSVIEQIITDDSLSVIVWNGFFLATGPDWDRLEIAQQIGVLVCAFSSQEARFFFPSLYRPRR